MTTETKWAARVKAWRESGQTAEEFAAGKEFAAGTLRVWASKVARGEGTVRMARVIRRPSTDVTVSASEVAIEVGVARIVVRRGFDPAFLREVMGALGATR